MITFQGRQLPIQYAEIIERKAHNVYPHVSSSKLNTRCEHAYSNHSIARNFFDEIRIETTAKLRELRSKLRKSDTFYADLVYGLQDQKVGNCFEEACLAELIGKMNGQKNIYVGDIFVEKENVENKRKIDHTVAFITNKKIKPGKEYYRLFQRNSRPGLFRIPDRSRFKKCKRVQRGKKKFLPGFKI